MTNEEEPERFLTIPLQGGGVRVMLTRTTKGRVMCCLCFDYCTRDQLNPLPDGGVEDVCIPCAEKEKDAEGKRAQESVPPVCDGGEVS